MARVRTTTRTKPRRRPEASTAAQGIPSLPALMLPHNRHGGAIWRMTATGIEVDGRVEVTAGEPASAQRVWSTWRVPILRWAKRYAVPVELIMATMLTETNGDASRVRLEPGYVSDEATPHRVSPGLMQTLISTARHALARPGIDRAWLLDPDHSIEAGTAYIGGQSTATLLDPPVVACAYNAGGVYVNDAPTNRWRMRQYPLGTGEHADRFVRWFNDCFRMFSQSGDAPAMSFFAATRSA